MCIDSFHTHNMYSKKLMYKHVSICVHMCMCVHACMYYVCCGVCVIVFTSPNMHIRQIWSLGCHHLILLIFQSSFQIPGDISTIY